MSHNDIIHRLINVFSYKEDYHLQKTQLLAKDLYVLVQLYNTDPIRVLEFAQRYHLAPSTLTGILDRLSQRKLIKRQRSKSDRKAVEIHVTAWGKRVVEMHKEEDERFSQNFFNALSIDKQIQLRELLNELLDNLDLEEIFDDEEIAD